MTKVSTMPKQVVILGGGYAGINVATRLDKLAHVQVTLVDRREATVHKLGGLRAAVDPEWQNKVLVPRNKLLKKGKIVNGTITQVNSDEVVMEDGKTIKYDILVCATGSVNRSPGEPGEGGNVNDMKARFQETADALAESRSVAIVGGGVVGVELAGEIRDKYPNKKITIVHSGDRFLSANEPPLFKSLQKKMEKQMKERNVEFILNDRAKIDMAAFGGKTFMKVDKLETQSGKIVEADLVFLCTGTKLNTEMYPSEWLNDKGQVKVNAYLQVEGQSNIFALGDITNLKENKLAYIAANAHAPVVAKNIASVAKGGQPKKKHKLWDKPLMALTFGRKHGVLHLPFTILGKFFISNAKGKSLGVGKLWGESNLKAPKTK